MMYKHTYIVRCVDLVVNDIDCQAEVVGLFPTRINTCVMTIM